jgi:hypothetical protein
MPKGKKNNTSIQISTSIHNALKNFCETSGLKMSKFTEKALLKAISGSYNKNYENDKISSRG